MAAILGRIGDYPDLRADLHFMALVQAIEIKADGLHQVLVADLCPYVTMRIGL